MKAGLEKTTRQSRGLVHVALFDSGERYPLLLDAKTLIPLPLPNCWVLTRRRDTKAASTMLRDLRVLRWLYEWAAEQTIDLDTRLQTDTLTSDEIARFARYLKLQRIDVIGKVEGAVGLAHVLDNHTLHHYLGVVQAFLAWAIEYFAPRDLTSKEVRLHVAGALDQISGAFAAVRKAPAERSIPKALGEEEIRRVLEVIDPASPENPFKPSARHRNEAIILLLLFCGLRRGELLKLTLDDLPLGLEETIRIRKSGGDPDDPRRDEPRQKTLARDVYVAPWLGRKLHTYSDQHRKGRGTTKYLFTNNRGQPLNYGGVHQIFVSLTKALPDLGEKRRLHPHALRHTASNEFYRLGREAGHPPEQIREAMQDQFGWAPGSRMPEHYSRPEIDRIRTRLLRDYQAKHRR